MTFDLNFNMNDNPFAGPAHHVALSNAIERDRRPPGTYTRPPPTGGEQISVRLSERLTKHLEVLSEASGWTRVQVLTALLERGMFDVYDLLSDDTGARLMENFIDQLPPVMHAQSTLLRQTILLAREVAGPAASPSPGQRPETFWLIDAPQRDGIPRMLVTIERAAAEDFKAARPSDQERALLRLRAQLEGAWSEAMENAGREVQCRVSSTILLPFKMMCMKFRVLSDKTPEFVSDVQTYAFTREKDPKLTTGYAGMETTNTASPAAYSCTLDEGFLLRNPRWKESLVASDAISS